MTGAPCWSPDAATALTSVQAFSDIVRSIYDAALTPENWPAVLSSIGAQFHAEGAVVLFYDRNVRANFLTCPELIPAVQIYMEENWQARDLHALRAIEMHLTTGDIFNDFDVATQEEIDSHPIFVDFFHKVGFGWLMSTVLLPELGKLVVLSVPRAKSKGPFTREEMEVLGLLGRHVEQALRISLRISDLGEKQTVLLAMLDRIDAGVMALGARGDLVLANKAGREQFENYFTTAAGRVTARSVADRDRFDAVVRAAARSEVTRNRPQSCGLVGADGNRLAAWAIPVSESGRCRIGLVEAPTTLIVTSPLQRDHMIDPTIIRDIFDVSLGEARLASLIGGGMPVQEAADKLGVAEGTARVVLQRVFRKLGVNRQAELVLRLSNLAGIVSPYSEKGNPVL